MTLPPPPEAMPAELREPRWGLGEVAAGWAVAQFLAILVGGIIVAASGYARVKSTGWPLWLIAVAQIPLWVGLAGAPWLAARTKGNGMVADFGVRFRAVDAPIGLVVGLASQFLLVPAISIPWVKLLGRDPKELDDVARQLTDKAHHSPGGVVLLVLVVVIGAPLFEELFYRGLALRALERRVGVTWAVVACGAFFGASHFELLQLPALAAFGMVLALLVVRTGRLGPAILAHLTFNATTVVALLAR